MRGTYGLLKAIRRPRDRVLFLSRQSNAPSADFVALADELRRRDPGLEIVMRCRMLGRTPLGLVASAFDTVGQMAQLASARICIVDGYVVPVSVLTHRPELTVIQLWHALGAIKKFGLQTVGLPAGHSAATAATMRMHANYDIVCCSGPDTVPFYAEAFGTAPERIRVTGLPRVDRLVAHRGDRDAAPAPAGVAELRRRFPLLADADRATLLYAPTMRRGGAGRCADVVARFADSGVTLIVKPHPLETAAVDGPHVVDAAGVDVVDLLPLCDVVLTDYSAVALEAAAIDVPVLFWVYDIEEYRRECGLNVDVLTQFPSAASASLEPLAAAIEQGTFDANAAHTLRARFVTMTDGRCTARIADLVTDALGGR